MKDYWIFIVVGIYFLVMSFLIGNKFGWDRGFKEARDICQKFHR